MKLSSFALDLSDVEDGKKLELGNGLYVRVRSGNSERAQKVLARLWQPYAGWREVKMEIQDRIGADYLAQALLTEFVGFESDDGEVLTFDLSTSADQARLSALLVQPDMRAFSRRLREFAAIDTNFQRADEASAEKN